MGSATRRRKLFLKENPLCAFCGGAEAATTIEHCPPKALFKNKIWPEGFEFPACSKCNNDTSDYDLIVSVIARLDPFLNPEKKRW